MTVSQDRGCVYVVSTPIGNLEDWSARARRTLQEVSLIACEDTRRTAKLCSRFEIRTPRVSLYAANEARRIPGLLGRLKAGESIALVSDAGTPLVSDPGARFVDAALEAGFEVVPVPGPSAILAALVASGLPTRPFTFVGFLPRSGRARRDWLDALRRSLGTLVIFEAPGRVAGTLADLHQALGPRRVAVAREVTKRFEEVNRGLLGEVSVDQPRGEFTLVVEGAELQDRTKVPSGLEPDGLIDRLLESGASPRDAARAVAAAFGISRSESYRQVLRRLPEHRDEQDRR